MDILLEYKSSRRQLEVPADSAICNFVERELQRTGWNGRVTFGEPETSSSAVNRSEQPVYLLQRWSERWGMFIDVSSAKEVKEGDRIIVVPKPVESPVKVLEPLYVTMYFNCFIAY